MTRIEQARAWLDCPPKPPAVFENGCTLTDEEVAFLRQYKLHKVQQVFGLASGDPPRFTLTFRIQCAHCGCSITCTGSKTRFFDFLKGENSFGCPECYQKYQEAKKQREEESDKLMQEEFARLRQLRTMPYRDYLETPEWKERRSEHIYASRGRCQICNTNALPLNVHHRTYERRGEEYFKDLITLCQSCHTLFHKNGKLART